MTSPFNPLKEWHKSINGAVPAAAQLRLRVMLPRNFSVTACRLIIGRGGSDDRSINMKWDSTDGSVEWWQTDIVLPEPAVFFYMFQYENSWGLTNIGKPDGSFEGQLCCDGRWQLTVYSPDFRTPDWLKGGIIYQIFPDRFCRSGQKKANVPSDIIFHNDTGDIPGYEPDSSGTVRNNDYFGGDFKGIESRLDYIKALGVNLIYLNPICEAHSNHRYNTADYMKPDPLLGSMSDFCSLCREAKKRGIKIITDGVFSHTGDDSIYFNKYGRYKSDGAYNSKNSVYYPWYSFGKSRDDYACWWGIKTLPEVDENNPSYTEFITGENGVIAHWLNAGASGIRLDVADELPDEFLDNVRLAVKRVSPDNFIAGEVWEDASCKISHGGRRRFLLGAQLDSVTNYPFRNAVTDFLLSGNAERFMYSVTSITQNYPPEAMHTAMNISGTHDTARLLSVLSGVSYENKTKREQAEENIPAEDLKHGITLLKAAFVINYTLPGVPCIYYGDEAGMTGGKDPFNRKFFPWQSINREIVDFVTELGKLRASFPVLKNGDFFPISAALGCAAFLRYKPGEKRLFVIVNKNTAEITYWLNADMTDMKCVFGGKRYLSGVIVEAEGFAVLGD